MEQIRWFLLAFHTFVYILLAVALLAQLSAGVLLEVGRVFAAISSGERRT